MYIYIYLTYSTTEKTKQLYTLMIYGYSNNIRSGTETTQITEITGMSGFASHTPLYPSFGFARRSTVILQTVTQCVRRLCQQHIWCPMIAE